MVNENPVLYILTLSCDVLAVCVFCVNSSLQVASRQFWGEQKRIITEWKHRSYYVSLVNAQVFTEFAQDFFAPTVEAHKKYHNAYDNLTWKNLVSSLSGIERHLFFTVLIDWIFFW